MDFQAPFYASKLTEGANGDVELYYSKALSDNYAFKDSKLAEAESRLGRGKRFGIDDGPTDDDLEGREELALSVIGSYFKLLSLSNPASAQGSLERVDAAGSMRPMNSTFTPPLTRRPVSASRAGASGSGNVTGTAGFHGPSSLPATGASAESSHMMRAAHNVRHQYAPVDHQSDTDARRNANLQRLRGHRSLDASELSEYDPLLQPHHAIDGSNAAPPADPSAGGDTIGQSAFLLPYSGGFSSLSHGNLLHLTSAPGASSIGGGGPFSNALLTSNPYGQSSTNFAASNNAFSNPQLLSSSGALSYPVMGAAAVAGGGSPYSYQFYMQQQQQPTPFYYPQMASSNNRDAYSMPLPILQREYELLRREYENTTQKLNSNMNSIKTFWSPELKKERSMRKEEAARSVLIHEQLRMVSQEAQRQAQVIRQLQTELQCQYELSRTIRDTEMQSVSKEQYEAVRLERERLQRELALTKETLRDVEMQIDSQRQTLAAKDESIKKLLDMLQAKGTLSYSAAQDRLELEQCRHRQIDLENRCRRYEASLQQKEQEVRALRDEYMAASEKLRQTQTQFGDYQPQTRLGASSILTSELEATALRSLLDTKQARIGQLEQRMSAYESEITHLRELRGLAVNSPRDYGGGEKSVTDRDYQEIKTKVEKLELELTQKQSELQTNQTRLATAEEQAAEMRKRIDLTKDSLTAKEQQIGLLQADVKALRGKLESRNEAIEQKTHHLQQAQLEKNRQHNEVADLNEQLKIRDGKMSSLQRKIDSLEDMIKERDNQIEILKQRIAAPTSSNQQQKYQEKLDELNSERDRLMQQMREQSDRIEGERLEELEVHRREVRDLRMAIESLQKDITDRQVLIESQHEKISDLNREMTGVRADVQTQAARQADGDFYVNEFERLNRELQETRNEVERLLKMVSALEKEKEELNTQIRMLEKQIEESQTRYSTTFERKIVPSSASTADTSYGDSKLSRDQHVRLRQKEHRVEELEEALKESVSITAERELAMAQQKLASQQLEAKMREYKEQMAKLQHQYDELNNKLAMLNQDKQDKDSLIRSLKHERKKHLEEVLQLKEEALLAAISEKDAHIALLETSQTKNPEEVESLRRHKEKLIRKLKEENSRRVKLFNEMKDSSATSAIAASTSAANARPNTVDTSPALSSALAKELKSSPVDQIVQSIRFVELQKKKLRVFIDQLLACILDIDPELLTGLPRTQQSSGVDIKLLKKLTHEQLLLELQQRDTDSLQLQRYATQLMQRLAVVQPTLVRRAMKLLDSFNGHPSTSEAFFYERLSRHYQKARQQVQRPATALPSTQQQISPQPKQHRRLPCGPISTSTISLQALR